MIALTACVFLVLAVFSDAHPATKITSYKGVDPNTLACDPEGQIFLLLPHYSDCNIFYSCSNGKEVEFKCPAHLHFDFESQSCNFPEFSKCILRTPPTEEIEGSGYEPDVESVIPDDAKSAPLGDLAGIGSDAIIGDVMPMNIETEDLPQFHDILNCNRVEAASRQVAYKGDCQRFWRCIEGVPQALYCSDGLYFNEKSQMCDFEANTRCAINHEDELKGEFIVYK